MKFVLGVLVGALLTLGVATVFDGPTRALLARGESLVAGGGSSWNVFAHAVRRLHAVRKAVVPAAEDPPSRPVARPSQAQAQEPEQLAAVPEPRPEAKATATGDMAALIELPSPDRAAMQDEVVPVPRGTEMVWVPFRSQRSAQGFADRLTRKTQHPFHVTRLPTPGPGRYQVSYSYASELQRQQLAAQVHAATGQVAQ